MKNPVSRLALSLLIAATASPGTLVAADGGGSLEHDDHGGQQPPAPGVEGAACESGVSSGFACRGIELLRRLTPEELGGGSGSDSWGWKDPESGRYYALVALSNGTTFVDVTDPREPVVLGILPSEGEPQPWRDVKTYANHAFIVADNVPQHGMQVFDLTRLRGMASQQTFTTDAHYTSFGTAHNIAIDEESGYAYVVGSDSCSGGLHMIDISDPKNPRFVGCYAEDGYTHDVQCLVYDGPDTDHDGSQICLASNEDSLTIVDVTDKAAPSTVAKLDYPAVAYSHQGWLTDSRRYFLLGDELDETSTGANARTLVFDVSDLDAPRYVGAHQGSNPTIDHNLYVRGPFLFQANYQAGLRILLLEDLANAKMREIAYFDTYPQGEERDFAGAWNVYPFFDNGTLLVSDINNGLFILAADLPAAEASPINGRMTGAWAAEGLNDQGLVLLVGENQFGPYLFFTWYVYLEGQPYWLTGSTAFEYGVNEVDIPARRLEGLEFLSPSDANATRFDIGTLNLHRHDCNAIHLAYDFEGLAAGELQMTRLGGVEGRECKENY